MLLTGACCRFDEMENEHTVLAWVKIWLWFLHLVFLLTERAQFQSNILPSALPVYDSGLCFYTCLGCLPVFLAVSTSCDWMEHPHPLPTLQINQSSSIWTKTPFGPNFGSLVRTMAWGTFHPCSFVWDQAQNICLGAVVGSWVRTCPCFSRSWWATHAWTGRAVCR